MICEHARARIDELLDGELTGLHRQELEAHLETCDECRELVESSRDLLRAVAELPGEIMPTSDLWSEIRARLERESGDLGGVADRVGDQSIEPSRGANVVRPSISAWMAGRSWSKVLGIAASFVVALALGLALLLGPGGARTVDMADAGDNEGALSRSTEAAGGPMGYLDVRSELLAALHERRDSLSPQTFAVIVESLGVIDESITSISSALAEHPEDSRLANMLSDARRQELDLLRRAALLPMTSSGGGSAGGSGESPFRS